MVTPAKATSTPTITQETVTIPTAAGEMGAFLCRPTSCDRQPAVLLLMEAFGVTSHMQEIALRIAQEGYTVLVPDLYYRHGPDIAFGYDEVESAMALMWSLDFGQAMEDDLEAALAYLKSRPDVESERIGVTGFCLGGGLTFLTACRFSEQISAAAAFYGVVLDEWVDAIAHISVPIYLFFGGMDPFISGDRILHITSRFQALGQNYSLKVYADADHGFFCHERSSYNQAAAEDAWHELTRFFAQHLRPMHGGCSASHSG